jgi:hypothetical protein
LGSLRRTGSLRTYGLVRHSNFFDILRGNAGTRLRFKAYMDRQNGCRQRVSIRTHGTRKVISHGVRHVADCDQKTRKVREIETRRENILYVRYPDSLSFVLQRPSRATAWSVLFIYVFGTVVKKRLTIHYVRGSPITIVHECLIRPYAPRALSHRPSAHALLNMLRSLLGQTYTNDHNATGFHRHGTIHFQKSVNTI